MPGTLTTGLRARLEAIQQRKSALRDQLAAARSDHDRARAEFTQSNGEPNAGNPAFRAAQDAKATMDRLREQLELTQQEEHYVLSQAAGVGPGFDTYGESFLRDASKLRELATLAESTSPIGRATLGVGIPAHDVEAMIGRAIQAQGDSITLPTDGGAMLRGTFQGVRPLPQRRLRFLDLLPTAPMDGASFEYSQEILVTQAPATGAPVELDTGAQPVAPGEIKPQTLWEFVDAEAKARTIAHWTKTKKATLADQGQLETVIRSRLAWGVLRRLEAQVLSGDGTGQNLAGILSNANINVVPYSAAELEADQTLEGMVEVLLDDAEPNFVGLHPRDWATMLKAKASGSGEYFSGGPFVSTAEQLWGTTAVPAKGVPQGSALVGDTTVGLTVFIREGVNVLMSDSDQDDFVRNRVTLLGEGRFALAIWQPSAFALVHFEA